MFAQIGVPQLLPDPALQSTTHTVRLEMSENKTLESPSGKTLMREEKRERRGTGGEKSGEGRAKKMKIGDDERVKKVDLQESEVCLHAKDNQPVDTASVPRGCRRTRISNTFHGLIIILCLCLKTRASHLHNYSIIWL